MLGSRRRKGTSIPKLGVLSENEQEKSYEEIIRWADMCLAMENPNKAELRKQSRLVRRYLDKVDPPSLWERITRP